MARHAAAPDDFGDGAVPAAQISAESGVVPWVETGFEIWAVPVAVLEVALSEQRFAAQRFAAQESA